MVLEYLSYLYYAIKYYLFKHNNYNIPFDINEIETNPSLKQFQENNDINKVIFALNNIPDIVQRILFQDYKNINDKYLHITIKTNDNSIDEIYHNLEEIKQYLTDDSIRYINIRINLVNIGSKMHHVNCIVIDKLRKYILIFEPKTMLRYDHKMIKSIFQELFDVSQYEILTPHDIGYSYYNRLQWNDAYCQTYIIFIFWLIILNEDIDPKKYSLLFNNVITHKNMGYFLFHINQILNANKIEICEQNGIWSYPGHNINNIVNITRLFLNNKEKQESELKNISIKEENDIIIFEVA
ncbi:hypothetical protein QKU48_gp0794 [Fadolivirus algeromassiliense]|jgi:hypothetical protein|uniref:Uncharacterized protein n=1 Tax=Fadolivirus FV1/VV64 TaxID=3070911 RepID=A0A7D3V5S9_9VIRU|nr:hypothetical protein QKU48_gp0794 [Fadolivirus algeromassiliense]QKF94252.1 hypothetical protein Fadolivirus_1_794 [Fadolivirus FV1/VV64]